jgi:hypothetical protein
VTAKNARDETTSDVLVTLAERDQDELNQVIAILDGVAA